VHKRVSEIKRSREGLISCALLSATGLRATVCLMVDPRLIPDPDRVLTQFQHELGALSRLIADPAAA
jgi:hypothetical protein